MGWRAARARLGSLRPQERTRPSGHTGSLCSLQRPPAAPVRGAAPPDPALGAPKDPGSLPRLLSRPSWSPREAQGHGASPPAPAPGGARPATRPGAGTPPGPPRARRIGGHVSRGSVTWARRSPPPPSPHLGSMVPAAWGGGGAGDCGAPGRALPPLPQWPPGAAGQRKCNALPASLPRSPLRPRPRPCSAPGRRWAIAPPRGPAADEARRAGARCHLRFVIARSPVHRPGGGGDHCRPRDADMEVLHSKYIPVMLPF